MDDRDIHAELKEAERRIAEHPAAIEYALCTSVEWSLTAVFRPNCEELLALLNAASTNVELAIELVQNMRPPIVRDQFQRAVAQRLHNYLAAAASLVDHVRRLMRNRTDEIAVEFGCRKSIVVANPSIPFMQDLRNYTLHCALPLMGHRFQEHPDGRLDSQVLLDVSALSAWDGWSPKSRKFLLGNPDTINLQNLCREHAQLLWDLNLWLLNALNTANAPRLSEVNRLIVERNAILAGGDMELAERMTADSTARNTLPLVPNADVAG